MAWRRSCDVFQDALGWEHHCIAFAFSPQPAAQGTKCHGDMLICVEKEGNRASMSSFDSFMEVMCCKMPPPSCSS